MAIICFKVSKTEKEKIMRSAAAGVVSGVKKRKTTTKRKTSVKKKR